MEPVIFQTVANLVERVGFPVAVAIVLLLWVTKRADQSHAFVSGELVRVIDKTSAALQANADSNGNLSQELSKLTDKIAQCPTHAEAFIEP